MHAGSLKLMHARMLKLMCVHSENSTQTPKGLYYKNNSTALVRPKNVQNKTEKASACNFINAIKSNAPF